MTKSAPLSIRIAPELKKQIEACAKDNKRSISSMVEIILEDYFTAKKEKAN